MKFIPMPKETGLSAGFFFLKGENHHAGSTL